MNNHGSHRRGLGSRLLGHRLEALEPRDLLAVLTDPMVVGGVSDHAAKVFLRTNAAVQVAIEYSTSPSFEGAQRSPAKATNLSGDLTAILGLEGLQAETKYYYRPVIGGVVAVGAPVQSFTTFAAADAERTFSFAVTADLINVQSNGSVPAPAYASIDAGDPAFVMQIGDFDHRNPKTLSQMRTMHRQVRNASTAAGADFAAHIAASSPLLHVWDDHDFGANNADKNFAGKAAALQAFAEYYPTPDRPNAAGIWHSFEFAQAEFFMLDVRSQADPRTDPNGPAKSMLDGDNIANGQLEWLKQGLLTSTATWKFLVSGVPFNPTTKPADAWGAYARERQELLDFIDDNNVTGVVVISGDLHSGGALDDGTISGLPEVSVPHTNLSTNSAGSGPVGMWSHGLTPGSAGGGYTWITVGPEGVVLEARAANGALRRQLTVDAPIVAPTQLAIVVATAMAPEGNAGSTPLTFTVTRTGDVSGTTTVQYAVTGSGATPANAADFGGALPVGAVSFDPDETSRTITVLVTGDQDAEPNEQFSITLQNPSAGAAITTATATGVIENDDAAPADPGLSGHYFNDLNLTDAASSRIDPTINFTANWNNAPPGTSVTPDKNYSVRWTGYVLIPTTGTWTFSTTSNDGVRLWVDDALIVNNWTAHVAIENSGSVALAAGWHPIRLEYFQKAGAAVITLSFQGPGQSKVIIPSTQLATAAPASSPAASLSRLSRSGPMTPVVEAEYPRAVAVPKSEATRRQLALLQSARPSPEQRLHAAFAAFGRQGDDRPSAPTSRPLVSRAISAATFDEYQLVEDSFPDSRLERTLSARPR